MISRNLSGKRGYSWKMVSPILSYFTTVSKAKSSSTSPQRIPLTETDAAISLIVILQAPLLLAIIGETLAV